METETVQLEKLRVMSTKAIHPQMLKDLPGLQLEAFFESEFEGMVMGVKGYVMGERLAEKSVPVRFQDARSVRYPATWWQHLKAGLPYWIARHLKPVDYQREYVYFDQTQYVITEQFATFPECRIKFQDGGKPVRFEQVRVSRGEW